MTSIPSNPGQQPAPCNPCTTFRDVTVVVVVALAALATVATTVLLLASLGVPLGSLNAVGQSFGVKSSLISFTLSAGTLGIGMVVVFSIMREIQRKKQAREQLPDEVKLHIQRHHVEEGLIPGHYVTDKLDDRADDQNHYVVYRPLSGPPQRLNFKSKAELDDYANKNLKDFKSEAEPAKTYSTALIQAKLGPIKLVTLQHQPQFKSLKPGSTILQEIEVNSLGTIDMVAFNDGTRLQYYYCRKSEGAKYVQGLLVRHWRHAGYEQFLPKEKECLYNAAVESSLKERLPQLEDLLRNPEGNQMLTAQLSFKINGKTKHCVILSLPKKAPMRLYFGTGKAKNAYLQRLFPEFSDALQDRLTLYGIPGLVSAPLQNVDIEHLLTKKDEYYAIQKKINEEDWTYVVYNDGKSIQTYKAQTKEACLKTVGKAAIDRTDWINSIDHQACNQEVASLLKQDKDWDYKSPIYVRKLNNLDLMFFHDGERMQYVIMEPGPQSEKFQLVQSTFYSLLPGEYQIVPNEKRFLAIVNERGEVKYKDCGSQKSAADWIQKSYPTHKDQTLREDFYPLLFAYSADHLRKLHKKQADQYCLLIGSEKKFAIYSSEDENFSTHYAPHALEGKEPITADQLKDVEITDAEKAHLEEYLEKLSLPDVKEKHYLLYPVCDLFTVVYWNSKGETKRLITRANSSALSTKLSDLQKHHYQAQTPELPTS